MVFRKIRSVILSLALAAIMLLTMLPINAFAADDVCDIGGTQYATLEAALAAISAGEIKTITLLKNIDYNKGIALDNKKITFALNGYTLNVVSSVEGVAALNVYNGGGVALSGAGALNVTGPARGYGVTATSNTIASAVTVTNAAGIGTESKAAHAYNKATLTVLGDVTATGINSFGVHAQAGAVIDVKGNVSAGNQGVCVSDATVKVAGNVKADGSDLIGNPEGIGVNVYDGIAEIGGNVTANRVGAMSVAGGQITIGGTLTAPDYIQFNDDAPTAIGGYLADTTKPGYRTYQHATAGTVWIKEESNHVCEIGSTPYTSLGEALAAVSSGGTIRLLQDITHTEDIKVENKTINLDLGNYNLLLDTSAGESYSPALMVINGGKVKLTGTGTGKFHVKAFSTAISAVGVNTEATVHDVAAGDGDGVYMVGSGVNLESNSIVTVLGSITVGNGNGVSMNAKDGKVVVHGNITAGRVGVEIASNPNTQATVNGNVAVDGDGATGLRAYGQTAITVTGDVTVRGSDCLGVHAYGSTITVGGNVVSSGIGAQSEAKGKVVIDKSLSAGSPFVIVGTTSMTAGQGSGTGGSLLYTDGVNTVQIGSVGNPAPTYTITLRDDGNGTASADFDSAAAGTEITLTATPNSGYRFKEWQVISGGVTVTDNTFTMPENDVTIKGDFEKIPDEITQYEITKGANSSWQIGATGEVEIVCNGDFNKFTGLKIDGVLLGAEQYTAASGSTVITLKDEYLNTLTEGAHSVELVYEDGGVQTEITILAAEDESGISGFLAFLLSLLMEIIAILTGLIGM